MTPRIEATRAAFAGWSHKRTYLGVTLITGDVGGEQELLACHLACDIARATPNRRVEIVAPTIRRGIDSIRALGLTDLREERPGKLPVFILPNGSCFIPVLPQWAGTRGADVEVLLGAEMMPTSVCLRVQRYRLLRFATIVTATEPVLDWAAELREHIQGGMRGLLVALGGETEVGA